MTEKSHYVTKKQLYELRQTRFKHYPKEHPFDVCAVARSPQELYDMTEGNGWWVDEIDWGIYEKEITRERRAESTRNPDQND